MKKTVRLLCILLAAMLMLPSCNININGGSYAGDDYLYVKGTAVKNKTTGLYEFASADIEIDYKDITDELVPVESDNLIEPTEENVMFRCENTRFSFIRYVSIPKPGYEFGEWKIRKLSDLVNVEEDYTYEYRKAKEGIEKAEKYLQETTKIDNKEIQNIYSPILEMLDVDLLPYVYPEYNRSQVLLGLVDDPNHNYDGDGNTTGLSLTQFREKYANSKEINVLIKVKDSLVNNDLSRFFTELSHEVEYPRLEEIHIHLANRENTNADIGTLLDRFEDVELENIGFGNINLTADSSTNWKFKNCHFNSLTVGTKIPVILENCKVDHLSETPGSKVIKR